ncbi:CIA30-domain-containing protein [Aulographum hederae CBS 113979]|uniref:CIA30-domain-containing protein n=1 Tax=Aulographum hederae CBS 113979 TaxID=1176131 RepID=A0A6G1H851_9PEZI|nr:CIA30-domain-containing protein [Aulographum hederae CBS 113979]
MKKTEFDLFGSDKKWNVQDWTASDDRVRGGKSHSYLKCSKDDGIAEFYGNLDIKTLGGAGFASQRTVSTEKTWDLSEYDGIEIRVSKADSKRYTFNIKDELLSKNPANGREQATISYEYDFQVSSEHARANGTSIFIPWSALKATYRGKEKKDAADVDTKHIKRFSLMMRSFFGDQEGDFSLSISSISAVKTGKEDGTEAEKPPLNTSGSDLEKSGKLEHFNNASNVPRSNFVPTSSLWARARRNSGVLCLGGMLIFMLLYAILPI